MLFTNPYYEYNIDKLFKQQYTSPFSHNALFCGGNFGYEMLHCGILQCESWDGSIASTYHGNVIIYPCLYLKVGWAEPHLKLGYTFMWVYLSIHDLTWIPPQLIL